MKTLLILSLALTPALAFGAANHQPGAEKLQVNFPNWQHYTDIKDSYIETEKGEQGILNELKEALTLDAKYAVPDGDHLTITFSDIDLAGDFEPWRGPQWDDVRVVKDIYPPRFKFTYTLTDGSGKVLKQGPENIVDMAFQMRVTINRDDPLRYEKDILKDWMDRTLRTVQAR